MYFKNCFSILQTLFNSDIDSDFNYLVDEKMEHVFPFYCWFKSI